MTNKILYLIRAIRHRGLRFIWDFFRESIWFDIRYGTTTFSRVPKTEQTIESSEVEEDDGLLYVASFTSVTQNTVKIAERLLGSERSQNIVFVDLGCGKGKALLVYARDFFKKNGKPAIGIEYDPVLADQARANVEKLAFARDSVEIILDSATNLRQHLGPEIAIIYLYNSFQGETLDHTLDALIGLPHILIYVDPAERFKLPDRGYKIVAEKAGRYNANTWLVATSSDLPD